MSKAIRAPGSATAGLRIGLLGGSFNPAHEGHEHASEIALAALKLDYVWWLVSPQNPLKPATNMATLKKRVGFAKKIVRDPRIRVTDIEAALGTRYTVDTLAALKQRFPKVHFVWLMGSDNFIELPRWRDWKRIFALVPVAVVPRPGTTRIASSCKAARAFAKARMGQGRELPLEPPAWTILKAPTNRASATRLRANSSWNC